MQIPQPPPESPPARLSTANPIDPQWTILKILQWTTSFFTTHQIDSPRLTAEILLAHVLGVRRLDLYLRFDQPLNSGELAAYREVIKRRARREPVAYITGMREFWGIDFAVTPDVLIPRPETEHLVEAALELIPAGASEKWQVLDVGTGSGAIVVSLAVNRPDHSYVASDISAAAITMAAKNAAAHGADAVISFLTGESFAPVQETGQKFDLIVSNPPYIPSEHIAGLAPEVGHYEPHAALDGGPHGLDIIDNLIKEAPNFLKEKGGLMMEIGFDQKDAVTALIEKNGRFDVIRFIRDYSGHDRVVVMKQKGN